jgi:site-specific DNA-cytosine methylase
MGKDTYAYIHPTEPRTISLREAARIQTFPDWFSFAGVALTDGFKMVGNAVPPLLSNALAARIARVLVLARAPAIQGELPLTAALQMAG